MKCDEIKLNKNHGKFTENSQKIHMKIHIKIHMKIHTKIRTEKNSREKNSQELGTGIPDLASNFGILF